MCVQNVILVLFFSLFSERKLQSNEFPHNIYIQNYSTATATCITLKKWIFSITRENFLNSDPVAVNFLFGQVILFYSVSWSS